MITEAKKQVTIVIAGRSYPVQMDPVEEREVKTVVAEVNARVESIQSRYPKQDKQDCLAMAILMYASELHKIRAGYRRTRRIARIDGRQNGCH